MRWTIRRVHVLHGRGGHHLVVTDTAWWALAVSAAYEQVMKLLGHPCCGHGPGRLDAVFALAWHLLLAATGLEWDHTVRLVELPVDEDAARALWRGDTEAWQELFGGDDAWWDRPG